MSSPQDFRVAATPALLILLVLAILASLCIGAFPIPFAKVARILFALAMPLPLPTQHSWTDTQQVVVQVVRLPRILVATLAGMGLGLSGAALQGMMRNPLVGPDLVGVTSGAAFGGVLAMLLNLPSIGVVTLAFVVGLTALLLTAGDGEFDQNRWHDDHYPRGRLCWRVLFRFSRRHSIHGEQRNAIAGDGVLAARQFCFLQPR